MPLSADQQAMLQLLLERGQTYADLGGVLGVDEAEVRRRARAALTELGGHDPDRNVGLTDYLLGQADPIGRADAVRHLKDDPDDLALASELSQKLRLLAPQGELPRLPGEERRPRARRVPRPGIASRLKLPGRLRRTVPPPEDEAPPEEVARTRTTLTKRQAQLLVALGSVAVLIVVVVLAVAGVFSGGSSSGSTSAGSTSAQTTSTTPAASQNLARVPLKAASGQSGSGSVTIGLANQQQPFVQTKITGLKTPSTSQAYVLWFLLTPNKGYPLTPLVPCSQGGNTPCLTNSGAFLGRLAIPPAFIPVLGRVQLVNVSLAPVNTVRSIIQRALQNKKIILTKPGTTVLQGAIPRSSNGG